MHGKGPWGPYRGWGRGRGGQQPEPPAADDAAAWVAGRVPDEWFTEPPTVTVDRDEVVIVGTIAPPELAADASDADRAAAEQGRISRFREQTRDARIGIAQQIEHRYRRHAAWGASCGTSSELFTTMSVPVMTRLRQPERKVLDTLVDSGVAKSRSEALAWCVRLVGQHADAWLGELREAMSEVDKLRRQGPDLG
ncbi:hypothetical protein [Actinocatenispora rupis]|uniref:Smu12A n=1 Tax=Actinocatenispora rupis TaxID=519421 RepID=A0A8J3IXD3_9ACTN|nr:hypothetical protein [Actinocatenispora rupis]GID10440.1 hypothetical protein Aru02nite_13290 [Actinocatenispora rupis]